MTAASLATLTRHVTASPMTLTSDIVRWTTDTINTGVCERQRHDRECRKQDSVTKQSRGRRRIQDFDRQEEDAVLDGRVNGSRSTFHHLSITHSHKPTHTPTHTHSLVTLLDCQWCTNWLFVCFHEKRYNTDASATLLCCNSATHVSISAQQ